MAERYHKAARRRFAPCPLQLIDIGINLAHDSFDSDRADVIRRADRVGVHAHGRSPAARSRARALPSSWSAAIRSAFVARPAFIRITRPSSTSRRCRNSRRSPRSRRSSRSANAGWTIFAISRRAPAQAAAFRRQLDLAVQLRKPVFLHQRDAHDEFLAILREYGSRLVGGVAHCFTAGADEARAYLDLGLVHRHHRLDLGRAPRAAPARSRAHDPGGAAVDRDGRPVSAAARPAAEAAEPAQRTDVSAARATSRRGRPRPVAAGTRVADDA